MADGKTHNRVTSLAAVSLVATGFWVTFATAIPMALGCLTGILLTPDIDVDNGSRSNYHARKLNLGLPFKLLMQPYSLAFKHRSNASHLPVFSTLFRLAYILLPVIVVFWKNQSTSRLKLLFLTLPAQFLAIPLWVIPFYLYLHPTSQIYAVWWLIGLMVSDTLHYIFDIIPKKS